jgi:hypothetical protein
MFSSGDLKNCEYKYFKPPDVKTQYLENICWPWDITNTSYSSFCCENSSTRHQWKYETYDSLQYSFVIVKIVIYKNKNTCI